MDTNQQRQTILGSSSSKKSTAQDLLKNDTPIDDKDNPSTETKRLDHLVESSQQPLMIIKSKFPFQLVPDQLIIDVNKVSFMNNTLFSRSITALEVKDVTEVIIANDLLFASLSIESKMLADQKITITHLSKTQARKAHAILHGMIACFKQGINYQETPSQKLIEKLELIGKPNSDQPPIVQMA